MDEKIITLQGKKSYVRPDETIAITCPYCSNQREVFAGFFEGKHKINVKCCNRFQVIIEFRKSVRKKCYLKGTFANQSQEGHEGTLIINDLSVTGLSFTCHNLRRFQVDDEVEINFMLEEKHETGVRRTPIKKEVIVRNIRENCVGCEFTSGFEYSSVGPLGYYVMHCLT